MRYLPKLALTLISGLLSSGTINSFSVSPFTTRQCISPSASATHLMAKKKKAREASTSRGFGNAPPTVEEVAATFKTRFPKDSDPHDVDCPCQVLGKSYAECCQPIHNGERLAETPLEVLQSRYSAFYYRLPLFIMNSTHPESRDFSEDRVAWAKDLDKGGMFDSYDFIKLSPGELVNVSDSEALLSFRVTMRATKAAGEYSEGQQFTVQEVSSFLKDGEPKRWRYAGGDVRAQVEGIDDVILNK